MNNTEIKSYTKSYFNIMKKRQSLIDAMWHKYKFNSKQLVYECSEEASKSNINLLDVNFVQYFKNWCKSHKIHNIEKDKYYKNYILELYEFAIERSNILKALRFDLGTVESELDTPLKYNENKILGLLTKYITNNYVFVDCVVRKTYKWQCLEGIKFNENVLIRIEAEHYIIQNSNYIALIMQYIVSKEKADALKILHIIDLDNGSRYYGQIEDKEDSYNYFIQCFGVKPLAKFNYHGVSYLTTKPENTNLGAALVCDFMLSVLIEALKNYDTALKNRNTTTVERTASNIHNATSIIDIQSDDKIVYLPISSLSRKELIKYKGSIGTHSSPHPHHVSGHVRHYKNGKVIWVSAYNKPCKKYKGNAGQTIKIYDNNN